MGNKIRSLCVGCAVFVLLMGTLHAETILLTSGKTLEGKVIETTEEYIKVDFYGVELTYELKDVETIDGLAPEAFVVKAKTHEAAPDASDTKEISRKQILTYLKERKAILGAFTGELKSVSVDYSQAAIRSDAKQIEQVLKRVGDICSAYKSKLEGVSIPSVCALLNTLTLEYIELQEKISMQYMQAGSLEETFQQEVTVNATQMTEAQNALMQEYTIQKDEIVSKEKK